MNKNVIVGIVIVIVLIILGFGVYHLMKKSASQNSQANVAQTGTQKPAPANSTIQGTLKSLLTQGASETCTFSSNTATGTVYVAGGKMRGDFKSTSAQPSVAAHMIIDSGYSYVWTDSSSDGIKMPFSNQTTTPPANNQAPNLNQNYNFSCDPWTADASVFTPPTNITFKIFANPQITGIPNGSTANPSTGANSNACAACNQIPAGPGRNTCLTQLHCQ